MPEDKKDITPRAEVLREAEQLITGDRNETYGTPTQNFTNIAGLWNIQFRHLLKDGMEFSATDVALAMVHVKMARMVAQPKRDNFVDLAGYAACGYEALGEEKTNPAPEPETLLGVVPPRASGDVFVPAMTNPYAINVTTTGANSEGTAALVRGALKNSRRRPIEDMPHECGPCC